MARHCRSLAEQGVWAQIERLTNAAHYRKLNIGKPEDECEYPTLHAARETLAYACNCALTTIDGYLARFVEYGMLEVVGTQYRLPDGRWSSNVYRVMLHDEFCKTHACPGAKKIGSQPRGFEKQREHSVELVLLIFGLRQRGMSFKDIAKQVALPKTTLYRLYKQGEALARECGLGTTAVPVVPEGSVSGFLKAVERPFLKTVPSLGTPVPTLVPSPGS